MVYSMMLHIAFYLSMITTMKGGSCAANGASSIRFAAFDTPCVGSANICNFVLVSVIMIMR
jgi:hypothetical protein